MGIGGWGLWEVPRLWILVEGQRGRRRNWVGAADEFPGVADDDMSTKNSPRKHGTTHWLPRRCSLDAQRRIIGGPRETWLWWNCEPTLQTERARMETLYLRPARPRSIPIEQTWGLEHNGMSAAAKRSPRKVAIVERSGKPTHPSLGKADDIGEVTGASTRRDRRGRGPGNQGKIRRITSRRPC